MSFDLILPFLRPIEHLIRDDEVSEIMVNSFLPGFHRAPRQDRACPGDRAQ